MITRNKWSRTKFRDRDEIWLRGRTDRRPSGYEPDELPNCSTPRQECQPVYKVNAPPRVKMQVLSYKANSTISVYCCHIKAPAPVKATQSHIDSDWKQKKRNWDTHSCSIGTSTAALSTQRVIRVLEQLLESRDAPVAIRCDNRPEFVSHTFVQWAAAQNIRLDYIQPRNSQQNTTQWLWFYNYERPHQANDAKLPLMAA